MCFTDGVNISHVLSQSRKGWLRELLLSSVIWEPETPGADEADAEASSGRSISSCSGLGPAGGVGGWRELGQPEWLGKAPGL